MPYGQTQTLRDLMDGQKDWGGGGRQKDWGGGGEDVICRQNDGTFRQTGSGVCWIDSKYIIWCFTSSQPVQLHQGELDRQTDRQKVKPLDRKKGASCTHRQKEEPFRSTETVGECRGILDKNRWIKRQGNHLNRQKEKNKTAFRTGRCKKTTADTPPHPLPSCPPPTSPGWRSRQGHGRKVPGASWESRRLCRPGWLQCCPPPEAPTTCTSRSAWPSDPPTQSRAACCRPTRSPLKMIAQQNNQAEH